MRVEFFKLTSKIRYQYGNSLLNIRNILNRDKKDSAYTCTLPI